MMEKTTLFFRHLPSELSQDERRDLLYHLGATQARVMGRTGPMKNTAFATFPSTEKATEIVEQLHQVDFLGSKLVIEFAGKKEASSLSVVDKEGVLIKTEDDLGAQDDAASIEEMQNKTREIRFDSTFATWSVKHPRRPDLKYLYPPPTPTILTNILHALAAVPKFYVQVLHLMNKMDLPAPFGMMTPAPPVHADREGLVLPDDVDQREMDISSETESELESDEEEKRSKQKKQEVSVKRSVTMKKRQRKKPRLYDLQDTPMVVHPPTTVVQVSEVFEKATDAISNVKKIELKLPVTMNAPPTHHHPAEKRPEYSGHPSQYLQPQSPHYMQQVAHPSLYDQQTPSQQQPVDTPSQPQQQLFAAHPSDLISKRHLEPSSHQVQQQQQQEHHDGELQQQYLPAELPPSTSKDLVVSSHQTVERGHRENASAEPEGGTSDGHGGFGILQPIPKGEKKEEEDVAEKEWKKTKFISSSQLRKNRLSKSEMKEWSVFRRYAEGEPSCRLYIKNLAKQVTDEDLHWVFGRYVDWDSEVESNMFDIRLMKEGRMKGQAFITYATDQAALSALRDTNAFVLQDKPLVVQFARSAKAEEDKGAKQKQMDL